MNDLSKRAKLVGVREVRGLVTADPLSPTGVIGADWGGMVSLRADADDPDFWTYRGEASVVDHPYTVRDMWGEFTETIVAGAFDKTLGENPDVMLNYMHDPVTTMATTRSGALSLSADPNLSVDARIDKNDMDAQRVMPKVQRGDATSMSFAFRVTRQEWNEDYTERWITEVNLHRGDVAVIVSGLGANPAAWGTVRLDLDTVKRWLDEADAETRAALLGGPAPDLDPEAAAEFMARYMRTVERHRATKFAA